MKFNTVVMTFVSLVFSTHSIAENGDLKLLDWRPKSQLVVKETRVLTEQHKQLINKAFDYIDKMFVIG